MNLYRRLWKDDPPDYAFLRQTGANSVDVYSMNLHLITTILFSNFYTGWRRVSILEELELIHQGELTINQEERETMRDFL